MFDKSFLEGFEPVAIVRKNHGGKTYLSIDKSGHQLFIPGKFAKATKWTHGQRLDLMHQGQTFALVPNKVGLVSFRFNGGDIKTQSGAITSADMCLKIKIIVGRKTTFDGWTEGDVLFFRPRESEEE